MLQTSQRAAVSAFGGHGLARSSAAGVAGDLVRLQTGRVVCDAWLVEALPYDIRVITEEHAGLSIGQVVTISWGSTCNCFNVQVSGMVHWLSHHANRLELGIALAAELPEELRFGNSDNQRRSIRFQCRVEGLIKGTGSNRGVPAMILNYSRGGMCVHADCNLAVGQTFEFQRKQPPVFQPRFGVSGRQSFSGIVRWTSGTGGCTFFGCQLTGSLGYHLAGVNLNDIPATSIRIS